MNGKWFLVLWGVLVVAAQLLAGAVRSSADDLPAQSKRTLTYDIDARLDAKKHTVTGRGRLTWRNDSPVEVTDMYLHLYLNAFKDKRATYIREAQGKHRGASWTESAAGSIEITSFKPVDGPELKGDMEFKPVDDANPYDTTVVRVPFPEDLAIAPGESASFDIEWTSQLPRVFARTGYAGDFHMVAQWFPKPGVFEPAEIDGKTTWCWNCHQYHGNSEFYADFGVYRVEITVPASYRGRVGASGVRVKEPKDDETNEDGTITYEFLAEDVHDFAWVCGEDFVVEIMDFDGGSGTSEEERDYVAGILEREPESLSLTPVKVYFLLQPEHIDQLGRHKRAIRHALTYLGFWFGRYPYSTLTVVDPDHRGRDAGGMEYPTLITGGTRIVRPERQLSPEGVLIHEFAHQYFYGMLGSNEFENAWMDEGMTTYATGKALMRAYEDSLSVTWYGGYPLYSERPFAFSGLAAESRGAMPGISYLFDEYLPVPFGRLGPVRSLAGSMGVNHPPPDISLWVGFGEVSPIAFLREIPPLTHLRPLPRSVKERERNWYAASPIVDPIAGRKAWEYMNRRSYGLNSYGRTACSLRTLEGLVGEETMIRIMRTYAERFRFEHPQPRDFFDTATEVAAADGKGDIAWFFHEFFERAAPFDFGIEDIQTQEAPHPDAKYEGEWYESIVTVRRFGDVRIPMAVNVRFDDAAGTVRRLRWERDDTVIDLDGGDAPQTVTPPRGSQARWVKLYFQGPHRVSVAEVDPLDKYSLDRDRTNDGLRRPRHGTASWYVALRVMGWVEMTTSFYGGI